MKIAFSGAQGTGKTYSTLEKAKELKIKHPNKTVGVLSENAINCPLPINQEATFKSQLWIFADQLRKEIEMSCKFDILVCDRAIFDAIAYTWRIDPKLGNYMLGIGQRILNTYTTIYFKRAKTNNYVIDDGLRDTDVNFREEIDKILEDIYYRKLKATNVIEV